MRFYSENCYKKSAVLIVKPVLVFPAPKAVETPKLVFKSQSRLAFKKTIFVMRIAAKK
jgi:hypothetical protein